MRLSREHLQKRLEHGHKELDSGRLFLRIAAIIVAVNILAVSYNLWRGWRTTDYFYAFILVMWAGFFIVQRKIQGQKQAEMDQLNQVLQKD